MNEFTIYDQVSGLVSMGLRFTEIVNAVNQARQNGADADKITSMLSSMAGQAAEANQKMMVEKMNIVQGFSPDLPIKEGEVIN